MMNKGKMIQEKLGFFKGKIQEIEPRILQERELFKEKRDKRAIGEKR